MNSEKLTNFGAKLATTTALVSLAFAYGARTARAGVCTAGGGGVYNCSGAANPGTDVAQYFSGASNAVTLTTSPGFGIDPTINSPGQSAIWVQNGKYGISITDNNASVITGASNSRGIFANNTGSGATGDVTVTTNGDVSGGTGIQALNNAVGGNVTVTANNAYGTTSGSGIINEARAGGMSTTTVNGTVEGRTAVRTSSDGGDTSITVNGSVNGLGNYGVGVRADVNNGGDQTITVASGASVTGNTTGIDTVANGGTATITVSGTVTAGNGASFGPSAAGIHTDRFTPGGVSNIILNSGANVSAGSGVAISNGTYSSNYGTVNVDTTANVTVNAGATVTGAVNLGDGTDSFTFNGGSAAAITTIDGGNGTDALTFTNGSVNISGSQVTNFETVTIGSGGNVSFNGSVTSDVTVENGGTLSAGNSPGLMSIIGNLDLDASSTTLFEIAGLTPGVEIGGHDVIDVSAGTATLAAGAAIDIDFFAGFVAGLGDTFDVLVADDIIGDLNTLNFDFTGALLGSGFAWSSELFTYAGGANVGRETLRLTVVADAGAVPEPSSMFLLGAGMFGLWRFRRRRKAA
ncbi:MAG: PEP-CTERM sorting domain-containing protein [Alphaproteobacteria bacterium]|nr:PEP-CTERM sorting domain-containing protein [Alphaproteobacteria bacterium]